MNLIAVLHRVHTDSSGDNFIPLYIIYTNTTDSIKTICCLQTLRVKETKTLSRQTLVQETLILFKCKYRPTHCNFVTKCTKQTYFMPLSILKIQTRKKTDKKTCVLNKINKTTRITKAAKRHTHTHSSHAAHTSDATVFLYTE